MREAMAAPDADGWWDAMDTEMENLRSHDVYRFGRRPVRSHGRGCRLYALAAERPTLGGRLPHLARGHRRDEKIPIQRASGCPRVARAGDSPGHRLRGVFSCAIRAQPRAISLEGSEKDSTLSEAWRLTLGGTSSTVAVFTAADWGSHQDDRRSIGAYLVKIGNGSKKWPCVALSSAEIRRDTARARSIRQVTRDS